MVEEDFNSFFEQTQQSEAISLSFNNNIFIKEENNQPVEMIGYVKSVAYYIRFIFVLINCLIFGGFMFEKGYYDQYYDYTEQMFQMIKLEI